MQNDSALAQLELLNLPPSLPHSHLESHETAVPVSTATITQRLQLQLDVPTVLEPPPRRSPRSSSLKPVRDTAPDSSASQPRQLQLFESSVASEGSD